MMRGPADLDAFEHVVDGEGSTRSGWSSRSFVVRCMSGELTAQVPFAEDQQFHVTLPLPVRRRVSPIEGMRQLLAPVFG